MEKLPEGTIVKATLGSDSNSSLVGEICGVVNEFPVMGYTYIIRIMSKNGPALDDYPYSCVALPQPCFKLV